MPAEPSTAANPTGTTPSSATGIDAQALGARLSEFGARVAIESRGLEATRLVVHVAPAESLATLTRLREDASTAMQRLVDLTVVDRLGREDADSGRFVVVYQLHSPVRLQRLRVEVPLAGEAPEIDSVAKLWPAASWAEREAYDLFGIRFRGHSELRRILLDEEFEGAPLRKDHPRQLDRRLPIEEAT